MTDEQNGASFTSADIFHFAETLFLELRIAYCHYLIDNQNVLF